MFLIPMTLQDISQLRAPGERVPLEEARAYEKALLLIENDGFDGYELQSSEQKLLQLQMFFLESTDKKGTAVRIGEEHSQKELNFSCSACLTAGRAARTCPHQWAAFILLWQALVAENEQIKNSDLAELARELKGPDYLDVSEDPLARYSEFAGAKLESISLYFDELPMLKADVLGSHLNLNFNQYKKIEVSKEKELLSPRLWSLPEVFRKKVMAYSEHYFNEVNRQNRIADIVHYNFSNGMQISAKEILRHPLQKKITGDLLPQAKTPASAFFQWPLSQRSESSFVSQELDEIVQSLLANLSQQHRQGKLEIYLQAKSHPSRAIKINSIEFDPVNELSWRVEFVEKKDLQTEFALTSIRQQPFYFFESFALEPISGVISVHPWFRELSQLQEVVSKINPELRLPERKMPIIENSGEGDAKTILKYLRTRALPVHLSGESRNLGAHQSQTEIRLNEFGSFYIQHEARVLGQKNLVRKGWTTKTEIYLQTLSEGLPFLLKSEARDIATRSRAKREWDLKLLKHLGILQYVFFETLSFHFSGALIDGTEANSENIFSKLEEKIRILLIAGTGGTFIRDLSLTELCSRSVLACFEDFIQITLKSMAGSESFLSEQGEVILEGVVEREFRLLFEILKRMAISSGGESFRKSRTSFLEKVSNIKVTEGSELKFSLADVDFHFPIGETKSENRTHGSLEYMQALIPHGFKIYYRGQPLQELNEDDFRVDFVLQSESDHKFFNWFELNPKFFLMGQEVDPDNFIRLGGGGVIEYDQKLFLVPQKQMPSLRRLEKFWQKLQKGKNETGKRKNGDKIYQLPRSQTLELLALRSSGVGIRGDAEWNKLCDFYDNLGSATRELNLPKSMKAELKPYQILGIQWLQDLYKLKLGALLADDMGLGKTLQTLSFLDDLRDKNELGQVLIVVPSSLVFNWQHEVEKFTPELPLTVFSNRDKQAIGNRLNAKEEMVVITTYGLLMEHEEFMREYKWKVVIFDEAQNLKNITTKRTSSARALNAQFKICLTGTPMENHYGEFYSLVDILVPGSLGEIDDFRRQFVNTETVTREQMDDLKLKIRPLLLRRTKKEILDQLPEKQETKVSIAFEEQQKEIYRDIALSYNRRVQETMVAQGEASVQLQMLTALLRLRQACSDPAALPNVRYDKVPPKLETLLDSLQEIVESGESALVFTQFLQTLEHTTLLLKKANIPVFVLHGRVPTKQRQKILSDFNQAEGGAVLVMTLKTGGVGLNLTKASYVFHLEPWWNPSVENQATDRAHRLGQSKAVQVFRYIMHESLEEKIELLKDRKDRKFQSLFTETEKDADVAVGGGGLSKQDFDLLLGIKDE